MTAGADKNLAVFHRQSLHCGIRIAHVQPIKRVAFEHSRYLLPARFNLLQQAPIGLTLKNRPKEAQGCRDCVGSLH